MINTSCHYGIASLLAFQLIINFRGMYRLGLKAEHTILTNSVHTLNILINSGSSQNGFGMITNVGSNRNRKVKQGQPTQSESGNAITPTQTAYCSRETECKPTVYSSATIRFEPRTVQEI